MKIFVSILGPVLLSLVITACDAKTSEELQPNSVFFDINGRIDEQFLQETTEFFEENKDKNIIMRVTSAGGDAPYGILVGDLMLNRNVKMQVKSYCASACVQYLMPSAKSVNIEKGATVSFHPSPSELYIPKDAPQSIKTLIENFRKTELKFYAKRNINLKKLKALQSKLEPICYLERTQYSRNDINRYAISYRFTTVTPSLSILRDMGYQVTGYWPTDQITATIDSRKVGFSNKLNLRFVDSIKEDALVKKMQWRRCNKDFL